MIVAWMNYTLGLAALVIAFVGGTRVGQLQQQDRYRARRRAAALRRRCGVCDAAPGQACAPSRHRVPSQRSPR